MYLNIKLCISVYFLKLYLFELILQYNSGP
uniref:Uncharacterized protein n=1 Tax=Anguilla anguilla TaxID=7936 RepID=A0A0E9VL15_ANGAN